ncbi:hydantoin utilization protein B [Allostella vacuolata]|nr:hydantoin utilization protein B [Stella vacuolata]
MAIDPITQEIFANYCRATAESMAYTLYRTAHSTFVKETEDFTVGITTVGGETAAVPRDLGATWLIGLDYKKAIDLIPSYEEGDVCCTNDPYSGYVCTHAPDLHVWKPIFWEGELVCFTVGHIHNTDIGGAVPASLSRTLVEVHQEGIRVPPCKLYRAGVLNEELLGIMMLNVRAPEQNWGDTKALVGAMNTGERRIHEMIRKFGVETFKAGLAGLLDVAERQTREFLRAVPDGTYRYADYIDEDGDNGNPIRIALALTVAGDTATLDFSGSDPQLDASNNVPTGGHPRHTLLLVAVYYTLCTLNPRILINGGMCRPFTCICPDGSILNPRFPAAVGMRSLTCNRIRTAIFGAFSLALPDRMPAASSGASSIMNVMTTDNETGERIIAAINPIMGGGGALPFRDGSNGSGGDATFLKNSPIEITEAEVPIQVLRYGLEPDTGGPGRFRGGLAQVMEFMVFSPQSRITARNRDRCKFQPFGVLGGRAGKPSHFTLNPDGDKPVELGSRDILTCDPGDVIRIVSSGAGGYGDPFTRDVEAVLTDVRCGFVSPASARDDYGVAIAGDAVDTEATQALRTAAAPVPAGRHFDFGAFRDAYEAHWTRANYDAMTAILDGLPVNWRAFIKKRLFAELASDPGMARGNGGAVHAAFERIREGYPALRGRRRAA